MQLIDDIVEEDIRLPYVCGVHTLRDHGTYEDAVDVIVEHSSADCPAMTLIISPTGPSVFKILGFDPDGMRRLGNFLIHAANTIEAEFNRRVETVKS